MFLMKRKLVPVFVLGCILLAAGCSGNGDDDDATSGVPEGTATYHGMLIDTLMMGASDNAEVIKRVPGKQQAILVSSKARKITLLQVGEDNLSTLREVVLFENDPTESELTHIDISSDGLVAALSRTIIETDAEGAQISCGGELVLIDASDSETFGTLLKQVEVGPMPDSVDISDDDTLIAVANERDGPDAWGKCEVPDAEPSISVVDLSGGAEVASELLRVTMKDGGTGPREPESVMFSADSDLLATTLQDSHELVLFRVSELSGVANPTSDDVMIVALPVNDLGAPPWPDGVARFDDANGDEYFATAGEWNDTFCVISPSGEIKANVTISESDIPASFPRVVDEGSPLFSPDSIAPFVFDGRAHLAFSLRQAGATAIYDVSDLSNIKHATAIQVGENETGGSDEDGSSIRPEGITASDDGSFILTANEGESSVSLIIEQ